ncbi:hypothetical protein MRX96_026909 [Rhipicephalus microplus]
MLLHCTATRTVPEKKEEVSKRQSSSDATSDATTLRSRAERGAGADIVPRAEIYCRSRALMPALRKASSTSPPPLRARQALILRVADRDASAAASSTVVDVGTAAFHREALARSFLFFPARHVTSRQGRLLAPDFPSLSSAVTKHIKCSYRNPTVSQFVLPFAYTRTWHVQYLFAAPREGFRALS